MQARRDDLILNISIALGIYYLFVTAYSISAQMYYFADGGYFFLHLLEVGDFVQLNPNRIYAHYATQFLPVAAIKMFGIRDHAVLSYLYGINLHLPLIACLAICYSIAKNTKPYLMVFPLLSLFGVSMNSMIFVVAQAHVISSVFWAIIFYMTLKEKYSLRDSIIFFTLVLIFMKSYESALFLGPILAFISFPRIFRKGGPQKLLWAAATVLFVASAIIALREILHPFDAGNRTNFIMSVFDLYRHYSAVLSLCFILVISVLFFLPGLQRNYFVFIALFLSGLTLLVSFGPLLNPNLIKPYLQYNARVMMAYVVPLIAVLFYILTHNRMSIFEATWKRVGILTAILVFGQISWQMIAVSQWDGYRKVFKDELSNHRGLLFFEDSLLAHNNVGNQLIKPFVWGWTVTTMSILWSEKGNVSTIITNNPQYATWGPFDPAQIDSLPKIERFDFSYKTYRESPHEVDRTYTLNQKLIFSQEGNFSRYIQSGWSKAEASHLWTDGKVASMVFKTEPPDHDPTIDIEMSPFVAPPRVPKQRLMLLVNGEKVGQSEITVPGTLQFAVHRGQWVQKNPVVLEFMLPDAISPSSIGYNNDTRVLALAFKSLTIR